MKRLALGSILGFILASALAWAAYTDVSVGSIYHATNQLLGGVGPTQGQGPIRAYEPATETIAAAATITADACGTVKRVTAAGAVTTNTTNTFTAPSKLNEGCILQVCNTGANAITLDDNALFFGAGVAGATPGDTVLGADDCCGVASDGAAWRQLGACAQG